MILQGKLPKGLRSESFSFGGRRIFMKGQKNPKGLMMNATSEGEEEGTA
jgi:hypothetical protein